MRVASTVVLVVGISAAACYFASTVAACWLADRLTKLCRQLGGDPPRYSVFLWGPGPRFWDYILRECRRPGREKLRALAEKVEVALAVRTISALVFMAGSVLAMLLRCLVR